MPTALPGCCRSLSCDIGLLFFSCANVSTSKGLKGGEVQEIRDSHDMVTWKSIMIGIVVGR